MITQTVVLQLPSYRDRITLYPLGCLHLGHVGCDKNALRKTVQEIKDNPNAWWLGMGDYAEYIGWSDPRFDAKDIDPDYRVNEFKYWGQRMNRDVMIFFEPIADKCLGIKSGNHEMTVQKRYLFDPAQDLADRLKVKYLGYESLIRLFVGQETIPRRYSVSIYATHGFGGGKKPGSHINNLVDLTVGNKADIYIMAHNHRLLSTKTVQKSISLRGKLQTKELVFLTTGTYLNTKQEGIEGYEVRKGFMPLPVGGSKLDIWCEGKKHDVRFELRI